MQNLSLPFFFLTKTMALAQGLQDLLIAPSLIIIIIIIYCLLIHSNDVGFFMIGIVIDSKFL